LGRRTHRLEAEPQYSVARGPVEVFDSIFEVDEGFVVARSGAARELGEPSVEAFDLAGEIPVRRANRWAA
jgi:hypothetical protein